MGWDPAQYAKFADHRLRPAVDLLQRIELAAPAHIDDLGAGSGDVTALLAERWPRASIVGVDSSQAMLARAAARAPHVSWRRGDLASWVPERAPDLIFSNAAMHWVPDHGALLCRLMGALAPGGVLAVQMPRNFDAPSHTAIAEVASEGPWRRTLEPLLRPSPVAPPAFYVDALLPLCDGLDVWETEYQQLLPAPPSGEHPVKAWTRGTWLKPLLDALAEPARTAFEAAYAARLSRAYPRRLDGTVLFPFKRLFVVARR